MSELSEAAQLPFKEQCTNIYPQLTEEFYNSARDQGIAFLDSCEETGLINNYQTGSSNRDVVLGILLASAKAFQLSADAQTRQEMQACSEESQYGMQIADRISDLSAELVDIVDALMVNSSHYAAVLYGRRILNVHYIDAEGAVVRDKQQAEAEGELE
jgi:hypothetical protein